MLRLTSCIPPGVPGNHWDGFHRDVLRRFQTVSDESPADAGLGAEAFQGCVCCTGVSRFHTRACLTESTQHSAPRETSRSPDGRLTCRRAGGKELGGGGGGKCWGHLHSLVLLFQHLYHRERDRELYKGAGNLHFPGSLFLSPQGRVVGSPSRHRLLTPTPAAVSGPGFSSEHRITDHKPTAVPGNV